MCRVCSVALWILQFIAIFYEPAHENKVLPGARAMKAQISLGKAHSRQSLTKRPG